MRILRTMSMHAVEPDTAYAIEIADHIWWVGHYLKDDVFQCHVYLMTEKDSDIQRLMKLNKMVRNISSSLLNYRDFRQVAEHFKISVQEVLTLESLEFYIHDNDGETVYLTENNR